MLNIQKRILQIFDFFKPKSPPSHKFFVPPPLSVPIHNLFTVPPHWGGDGPPHEDIVLRKPCIIVNNSPFYRCNHTLQLNCTKASPIFFFFKLGFTPCRIEQPLRGMELQEREAQKDYQVYKKSV